MARLIDADAITKNTIVDFVGENGGFISHGDVLWLISKQPTIEAEPVKHGKWLCKWDSRMGTTEVTCSVCKSSREILGCYVGIHGEQLYDEDDFCPKCGADMRGDNDGKMAESD